MTAKKKTLVELMLDAGVTLDDIENSNFSYFVCDKDFLNNPFLKVTN